MKQCTQCHSFSGTRTAFEQFTKHCPESRGGHELEGTAKTQETHFLRQPVLVAMVVPLIRRSGLTITLELLWLSTT